MQLTDMKLDQLNEQISTKMLDAKKAVSKA
jgi:hypothetical protein